MLRVYKGARYLNASTILAMQQAAESRKLLANYFATTPKNELTLAQMMRVLHQPSDYQQGYYDGILFRMKQVAGRRGES